MALSYLIKYLYYSSYYPANPSNSLRTKQNKRVTNERESKIHTINYTLLSTYHKNLTIPQVSLKGLM